MNYIPKQPSKKMVNKDMSLEGVSKKFGFEKAYEMLLWMPINYLDLSKISLPWEISENEKGLFSGKLLSKKIVCEENRPRKLKVSLEINNVVVYTNIIGPDSFDWDNVSVGMFIKVLGYSIKLGEIYFIKSSKLVPKEKEGQIIPIYKGKHTYTSEQIANAMSELAFANIDKLIKDLCEKIWLGEEYAENWTSNIQKFILNAHFPKSIEEAHHAKKKIKDLSVKYLLKMASASSKSSDVDASLNIDGRYISELSTRLGFALTSSQKKVINEIFSGFKSSKRMMRLINGDVGTGKTDTYLLPCIAAHKAGYKVGIVAPNDILARSITKRIHEIEPRCNVKLVVGEKDDGMYEGNILVGTSAVIFRSKKYNISLDVLVVDEEHLFSVNMKNSCVSDKTNVIYSTATCIPRTGALVQYGDVEISILDEFPVQKNIESKIVKVYTMDKMYDFLESVIKSGHQSAVIFNKIKFKKDKNSKSLEEYLKGFEERFGDNVGIIHGKLKDIDKQNIIEKMMSGQIKVLLSTTLISIGVTIPSLFNLIVFDADYLGLAQLHQLRGRVARHGGNGKFIMIPSKNCDEDGLKKLEIISENIDGFIIAEKDLEMRGFGDLTSQSKSQSGDSNGLFYCVQITPKDVSEYINLKKQ